MCYISLISLPHLFLVCDLFFQLTRCCSLQETRRDLFASQTESVSTSLSELCVCLFAAFLLSETGGAQLWLLGAEHSCSQPPVDTRAHGVTVPSLAYARLKLPRDWHLWGPMSGEEFHALCRNSFAIPHIPLATCSHKNIMNPSLFAQNPLADCLIYVLCHLTMRAFIASEIFAQSCVFILILMRLSYI